jgi:hypothetical protein
MMALNRRVFLSASLTVGVGGGLQLMLSLKPADGPEARAIIELTGHFRDLASIRHAGQEALRQLPEGTDVASLILDVDPERPPEVLRREIQEQYAAGNTVDLGGWPIAVTEARIYALVALAN